MPLSSASRESIRSPRARRDPRTSAGSAPLSFIRRASAFGAWLRSALSWSSWPVNARRRMSSASSSSSSRVTVGSPRRASAARTCWGEARRSLRSITPLLLRESELETAVAAVLVDEDLEVKPPRRGRGVHGQHAQLGIERERHAERTWRGPRADQHDGPRVERNRLGAGGTARRRELDRDELRRGGLHTG